MNLVKVNVSEDTRNRLREINKRTGKYLYTILSEAVEEYYVKHILVKGKSNDKQASPSG